MSEKKKTNIYELTVDDLKNVSPEIQKNYIQQMNNGGLLISVKSAFDGVNNSEIVAKNIVLGAQMYKNKFRKSSKLEKLKGDLVVLESHPSNREGNDGKVMLKDILRNMNRDLKADIKGISDQGKYEMIINILDLENTYDVDYRDYIKKRPSKTDKEDIPKPNVELELDLSIDNALVDLKQTLENQGGENPFGEEEENNEDVFGDENEDENEIIETISCNENDYKCKKDQVCDLENQKCIPSKDIVMSKSGYQTVIVDGKTFYGSEQTLKRLRKCDVDKPCDDGKYCDMDNYKCVNEGVNHDLYYYVTLNGKKFYGSNNALKQLDGFCNFDKPCPADQKCFIDENKCYDAKEKASFFLNKKYPYQEDGVNKETIGERLHTHMEKNPVSQQKMLNMKDTFINSMKSSRSSNQPSISSKLEEKKEFPSSTAIIKQKIEENKTKLVPRVTKVPDVLSSGAIMKLDKPEMVRQSLTKEQRVHDVITDVVTGKTEQLNTLNDVQKNVLRCLGLGP